MRPRGTVDGPTIFVERPTWRPASRDPGCGCLRRSVARCAGGGGAHGPAVISFQIAPARFAAFSPSWSTRRRRNPMIHHCTFEGCPKSVEWPAVFFLPPEGWCVAGGVGAWRPRWHVLRTPCKGAGGSPSEWRTAPGAKAAYPTTATKRAMSRIESIGLTRSAGSARKPQRSAQSAREP